MIHIYGKTDKGRVRNDNQDSFFIKNVSDDCAFAVLCDGMGGANAGNVASSIAVETISEYIIKSYRPNMPEHITEKIMRGAVESANIRLFELSKGNSDLKGMGTTVVTVLVSGNIAYTLHAGDSRAYLFNGNQINRITTDHSVVQTLIDLGKITEEEAKTHPEKNVITRALGVKDTIYTDFNVTEFNKDNKILLCSDGLSNYFSDESLAKMFTEKSPEALTEALVNFANNSGGSDNITAVIISNDC